MGDAGSKRTARTTATLAALPRERAVARLRVVNQQQGEVRIASPDGLPYGVFDVVAASEAASKDQPRWNGCVRLTARQLCNALDFIAPDFDTSEEHRDWEVSIALAPDGVPGDGDGEADPPGLRAWVVTIRRRAAPL